MVEGIDDESTTVAKISSHCEPGQGVHSHQTGRQENDGIDRSKDPFVRARTINAEFGAEGQVGAVGPSLIPSLSGSTDGAQRDGVPEHDGAVPFVVSLVDEGLALVRRDLADHLKLLLVTGDEGGATEKVGMFGHALFFGEGACIEDGLFGGDALSK